MFANKKCHRVRSAALLSSRAPFSAPPHRLRQQQGFIQVVGHGNFQLGELEIKQHGLVRIVHVFVTCIPRESLLLAVLMYRPRATFDLATFLPHFGSNDAAASSTAAARRSEARGVPSLHAIIQGDDIGIPESRQGTLRTSP